jgi:phosphoribosyl-ATP pyrophosphohydrolase/phosphoribosyl-AMP cyclohydrolase/histidinol dehydrogenase
MDPVIRLKPLPGADVPNRRRDQVDEETLAAAAQILDAVRQRGELAVREYAERFDGRSPDEPLLLGRDALAAALAALPCDTRVLLERAGGRIRAFAAAQRACLHDLAVNVAGGQAGHDVIPLERAGCYAPGGRYPLPSSVLMTAIPARVAGVQEIIVATPRPDTVTLAAAYIAGADQVLAVGGAHAIAALGYGAGAIPACDVVVGPGNRWVTAAKQLLAGEVAIDMLAGPSELLVLADAAARPAVVAADLIAQAEHDPDARVGLVTTDGALIAAVESELTWQLADLPTADVARTSLANAFATVASDIDEACRLSNRYAPEHLALHVEAPAAWRPRLRDYGALFVGERSAEVFGDYGVGPNHTLPTGGAARVTGGLSVFTFLKVVTWMELKDDPGLDDLVADTAALARLERLEGHARSASIRLAGSRSSRGAGGSA